MPADHQESRSYAEICDMLDEYFQGLFLCDLDLLKRVFHPLAHYSVITAGKLVHYDMPTYFAIVAERTSAKEEGENCSYTIDSIEFADDNTALARMQSLMMGNHYNDFLNLIRVDDEWRIISKVFSALPR